MADALGNPWPWSLLAALLGGTGLGFLARALGRSLLRRRPSPARASIFGMVLLALALLFVAGLLVFPDKSALADRFLLYSGLLALGLGLVGGLLPRTFGLGLLLCLVAGAAYVAMSLDGWLPIGGAQRIATLTPFVVSPSGSQAELGVDERDSLPIIQRLDLPATNAGLVVERLELGGPLSLFGRDYYRVAGIASFQDGKGGGNPLDGSIAIAIDLASPTALMDFVLPLDPDPRAERSILFARRWREVAAPQPLVALRILSFVLDPSASRGSEMRAVEE